MTPSQHYSQRSYRSSLKHMNRLREYRGLSLRKLANRCGTSHTTIARILAGTTVPTITVWFTIRHAMGLEH